MILQRSQIDDLSVPVWLAPVVGGSPHFRTIGNGRSSSGPTTEIKLVDGSISSGASSSGMGISFRSLSDMRATVKLNNIIIYLKKTKQKDLLEEAMIIALTANIVSDEISGRTG